MHNFLSHKVRGIFSALLLFALLPLLAACNRPLATATASWEHEQSTIALATERSMSLYYGKAGAARGTGILLDDGRSILTVLHAKPGDGKTIYIAGKDQKRYPTEIIAEAPQMDLMLIRTAEELPHSGKLHWKSRDDIRIGEKLYLVGAPYGLERSLLIGYLSHTDRTGVDVAFATIPFLQTMGLSYPATSGGAIFDASGAVIGINRATYGTSTGNGIGLAIPATYATVFLKLHGLPQEEE